MLPEAVRLPLTLRAGLRRIGAAVGLVAAGLFVVLSGAALMVISAGFGEAGPAVAIALPALPTIVLAILVNPMLGVLAVLATFPVGSIGASFGFATLQAAEGAVLFIALVVVLRRLAAGRSPLPFAPELFWAVGLLAWMLLSLYSAIDETLALKAFISLSGGIAFACVVLAVVRGPRDVRLIAVVFVLVSAVISAVAVSIGSAFETTHGGAEVSGRLQGAFEHPNQLGALAAMAAPIAAALLFGARGIPRRLLAVGALTLIIAALGLSLSRGAWFGAGLAFLLMLVMLREARRLLAIVSIPVAIVGVVVWTAAAQRPEIRVVGERARSFTTLSPYDERDEIWAEATRQIKEDPITGQGPGSFPVASTRVGGGATTVRASHAHNIWLNWGAETGLGGLAFLTGLMVSLAAATYRAGRFARARGQPSERVLVVGIAAALLSVLGQGVVDYPLTNPVVHLAVWCLIGLLLAAARPSQPGRAV
jgi:putative inorganic carbon (hco3(-)) transporter